MRFLLLGHDFTNAGKNLGQYHWVKKVTTRTISLNTCSNFVPDEKDLPRGDLCIEDRDWSVVN